MGIGGGRAKATELASGSDDAEDLVKEMAGSVLEIEPSSGSLSLPHA